VKTGWNDRGSAKKNKTTDRKGNTPKASVFALSALATEHDSRPASLAFSVVVGSVSPGEPVGFRGQHHAGHCDVPRVQAMLHRRRVLNVVQRRDPGFSSGALVQRNAGIDTGLTDVALTALRKRRQRTCRGWGPKKMSPRNRKH
jgi:hypothetical protein